jgi:hypothetical protein
LLLDIVHCVARCKHSRDANLLIKPAAMRDWLENALTAANVLGACVPVFLATATSYPNDIETNETGFAAHGVVTMTDLREVGLACAVLGEGPGDMDDFEVDGIRVLPLGWVK